MKPQVLSTPWIDHDIYADVGRHYEMTVTDDVLLAHYNRVDAEITRNLINSINQWPKPQPNERSPKRMTLRAQVKELSMKVAELKYAEASVRNEFDRLQKKDEAIIHAMIEHAFHFDTALHYNPERKLFVCLKDFTTRAVVDAYIKEHLPQVLIDALYYRPTLIFGWEQRQDPTILLPNGKELT